MMEEPVRAEIKFTEDEWDEFIDGGVGFTIISDEIYDHRRWAVVHEVIVRREEDGTFWRGRYRRGATEYQEYDFDASWGHNDSHAVLTQVFPKEKTVITYE